jgi:transposase-like protein
MLQTLRLIAACTGAFNDEEKRSIVLEMELPGATVASVARRYGIVTSMIFRWRVQLGLKREKPALLATVCVTGTERSSSSATPAAIILQDLLQPMSGMKAVDLPDGRRVFVPSDASVEDVRRHVATRESEQ